MRRAATSVWVMLGVACGEQAAAERAGVAAGPEAAGAVQVERANAGELAPGGKHGVAGEPAPVGQRGAAGEVVRVGQPAADAAAAGTAESALPVAPDGTRALPCREPAPPGLACIPGGPFVRGSDDGPENTRPRGTVWLQTFYMDINEITYREYKDCVAEGRCKEAGPRYEDYDRPRQPIVGVSWYDAVAYCEALGKHLPSEAEWEKAARGPDGAVYPWGDEPATCERAIIKEKRRRSCGVAKLGERPDKGRTFEIGSKPPGRYGLYDMAGNAWEWVADWASPSWAACGAACAGVDPRGPCGGATPCKRHHERIVRGGSWYWEAGYATGYYRRAHVPSNRPYHHYGFRCAASVEQAAALAGG